MILGGGLTVDFLPPVRSIFTRLRELDRSPPCVSADVFFCHFLNDEPALGYSALAYADGSQSHADAIADELAERIWATRERQVDPPLTPREAIARARAAKLRRKTGAIFFADGSDAVGAGGTGENTLLLQALLEEGEGLVSYVPLRDPEVVADLWTTPIGTTVTARVGGKLDPRYSKALEVRGVLKNTKVHPNLGRMAWLDLGHVQLVLCSGPALAVKPEYWTTVGLSPWKADIIVAKSFFSFLLYFAPMLRGVYLVKTHGTTDFDRAFELPFDGPIIPRDKVDEWRPRDAERRQSPSIKVGNSPRG